MYVCIYIYMYIYINRWMLICVELVELICTLEGAGHVVSMARRLGNLEEGYTSYIYI